MAKSNTRVTALHTFKRSVKPLAVVALMATMLAGCGTAAANKKEQSSGNVQAISNELVKASDPSKSPANASKRTDTFIGTIKNPGGVFLPYFYRNAWDSNINAPIFASLVVYDKDSNPVGDLAKSWDISKDNLTYTYHLRDNAKFSDGSEVTADDVAFTLTLENDPAYNFGLADFTDIGIKGAEDYKAGKADSISGIKVIDSKTISITTEKVNPIALTTLGSYVLPKAYYGKDYRRGHLDYLQQLYDKPLGAGPYVLDKYIPGQEVRYTANANYYGGKPKIEHLILKVVTDDTALQSYQNGDTDADVFNPDPDVLSQLKDFGWSNVNIRTNSYFSYSMFNTKKPYLTKAVRQALYYGLDRKQIVAAWYKGYGQVANAYVPPTNWAYSTQGVNEYSYNPDKANKLLDDAGWKKGSDGIREKDGKKLTLTYVTKDQTDPIISIGKEQYKQIGIDLQAEVTDQNTETTREQDGDYDMITFRTPVINDPNEAVKAFGTTDPAINFSGYDNAKVRSLIKQGISLSDRAQRKPVYQNLYQELSNDPPYLLIGYVKGFNAWNARIQGGENFFRGTGDSAIQMAKLSIKK
ncbi:ABC transporter substrate-binding protein [Bifidobacterium tibiigranuli]|jgi:peptide/nickel transport system substrate-binding protein|uniref:ABC transporter substrate-binding protein n=1 Tax=Bifidobacterium tibiigranuli TaxID=2172043 RepID=UPI0026F0DEEF|nr:ABC transporter substrate-binding protein [Bifidobacterium tibiigranuli]MCI1649208.1 ABC transporter substrate-binding protein [Bifidobacterium tibiigranuli]MCI2185777.1 ABC transporter substrate-binding protein [Bifidobacterium tibiigranuli]MCI2203088.1 ABC transporter substrate-binding protein [Bifidobacterium tibiigranuli]